MEPHRQSEDVDEDEVNDECRPDDEDDGEDAPTIVAPSVIDPDAIRKAREREEAARKARADKLPS